MHLTSGKEKFLAGPMLVLRCGVLCMNQQTAQTSKAIITELQRVVAQDPRIQISDINVFAQENGFLCELEVETIAGQDANSLRVFFDNQATKSILLRRIV